jgi:flagellar basal-body rod modification protein FlgD
MQITDTSSIAPLPVVANPTTTAPTSSSTDSLGNENTFMQLLVAQLKNQDPTQPADGIQFVTQLAQFSSLEQLIGIRSELAPAATAPATPATPATPTV